MPKFNRRTEFAGLIGMPVKVLARDKNELRLRFVGESHTSLQVLREKLNADDRVDYANYFPGHPDLDDPEFKIEENDNVNNIKKEYSKKKDIIPSQDYYLHDLIKIHGTFDNIEEYNYLDYGTNSGYQPTVLYAISKNKNLYHY